MSTAAPETPAPGTKSDSALAASGSAPILGRPASVPSWGASPAIKQKEQLAGRHWEVYRENSRQRVADFEEATDYVKKLASRRTFQVENQVHRHSSSLPRVIHARVLLGTPLTRRQELSKELEGPRRDALYQVHSDCLLREEIAQRKAAADKDSWVAARRAEALKDLRREEMRKVKAKKWQHAEDLKHQQALEGKRLQQLAENRKAKEQSQKEIEDLRQRRKQHEETIAEGVAARRAVKEKAAEHRRKAAADAEREKEDMQKRAAQSRAEARENIERVHAKEYVSRLETVMRSAERAVAKFEAEAECQRRYIETSEDSITAEEGSASHAELARIERRLKAAQERAEAAAKSYEKAKFDSMSPEELYFWKLAQQQAS